MAKLKSLEKSWNGDVNLPREERRIAQMSADIRHFIMKSYIDPFEKQKIIDESQRKRKTAIDTYGKIHSTFGFAHHEGTDKAMELKVIKIIMIREGLLMSLRHLCEKAIRVNGIDGANLLELLSQIRDSTLNYLEALFLWRQTSQGPGPQSRVFVWEGGNYTLKIIHDLDFLSDNVLVTEALSLSPEQLYLNPLMLNNNLEDFNTWMEPYDRASMDVNGKVDDPVFESRLRLRLAERMLLQEMEASDDGSDLFITQQEQVMHDNNNYNSNYNNNINSLIIGSNALENEYEYEEESGAAAPAAFHLPEVRQIKSSDSAASNQAVSYDPHSRGSAYSMGLSSGRSSARAQSAPAGQSEPLQPFEYGHDFFTGHWMDNKEDQNDFGYPSGIAMEDPNEADGVLFLENGEAVGYNASVYAQPIYRDDTRGAELARDLDERSVGSLAKSVRSIESVGDIDVRALRALALPPKCLVLAASTCLILLTGGDSVPTDVSWKAFLRFVRHVNIAEAMSALDPLSVPTFKIIAVQPIVRQLLDEDALNKVHELNMPMGTYGAIVKIIKWVQQFTTSAIKKLSKVNKGKIALEPIAFKSAPLAQRPSSLSGEVDARKSKSKASVPKVQDLQTFHTEIVEGLLPGSALLLVILTGADGSHGADASESQRVVLKLYDAANSKEAMIYVNLREYVLLQQELCQKHGEKVKQSFQPTKPQWWAANAKHIVVAQMRGGSLHASISRRAIDERLFKFTSHVSPKSETVKKTTDEGKKTAKMLAVKDARSAHKPSANTNASAKVSSGKMAQNVASAGRHPAKLRAVSSSMSTLPTPKPARSEEARASIDNSMLPSQQSERPAELAVTEADFRPLIWEDDHAQQPESDEKNVEADHDFIRLLSQGDNDYARSDFEPVVDEPALRRPSEPMEEEDAPVGAYASDFEVAGGVEQHDNFAVDDFAPAVAAPAEEEYGHSDFEPSGDEAAQADATTATGVGLAVPSPNFETEIFNGPFPTPAIPETTTVSENNVEPVVDEPALRRPSEPMEEEDAPVGAYASDFEVAGGVEQHDNFAVDDFAPAVAAPAEEEYGHSDFEPSGEETVQAGALPAPSEAYGSDFEADSIFKEVDQDLDEIPKGAGRAPEVVEAEFVEDNFEA